MNHIMFAIIWSVAPLMLIALLASVRGAKVRFEKHDD